METDSDSCDISVNIHMNTKHIHEHTFLQWSLNYGYQRYVLQLWNPFSHHYSEWHTHTQLSLLWPGFSSTPAQKTRGLCQEAGFAHDKGSTLIKKSPVVTLGSGLIIHWSSRESQRSRSDEVLSCAPTPVCVASLSPVACVECDIKAVSFILIVYHFTTEADWNTQALCLFGDMTLPGSVARHENTSDTFI